MTKTFLIADTHFGHVGVTKFLRNDGTKLRPWDSVEEMDEAMVDNWNKVVGQKDVVWHLGDVVINRKALTTLGRLNGRKKLVKGNHDIFKAKDYLEYFEDIQAFHKLDEYALTHIPVHVDSVGRWAKGNIHGHLHSNRVMKRKWGIGKPKIDERYICVSVEHIDYTPIDFEKIRSGDFK